MSLRDRIKNGRVSVPTRVDDLIPSEPSLAEPPAVKPETAGNDLISQIKNEIASAPPTASKNLVIEEAINDRIEALCKKHKITRDTLVEAAFCLLEENDRLMGKAIAQAKERKNKRSRIGKLKRSLKDLGYDYEV